MENKDNIDDVWIFANPIAGKGKGRILARQIESRLAADGFSPRLFLKRADRIPPEELEKLARAAVVIGGDGTLRGVADRLLADARPLPPLLPIGLGTANLMVRHLGLNWEQEHIEAGVSQAIRKLNVRQLDAGRANGKLFLLMVGVGFDAQIVHELDRLRTGPIGLINYLPSAALALHSYNYHPLRVVLDGKEIWRTAPGLVFVGNIREYGTGFPVLPFARSDDHLLDVCVLPCRSFPELIKLFLRAVIGEHMIGGGAVYARGKNVHIESDAPIPVQIDGDPAGHTPVDINLLPVQMPFVVP